LTVSGTLHVSLANIKKPRRSRAPPMARTLVADWLMSVQGIWENLPAHEVLKKEARSSLAGSGRKSKHVGPADNPAGPNTGRDPFLVVLATISA
jgi:hypothetical protein